MPAGDDRARALQEALGRVITMRRAELRLKRNDLRDRSNLSYPYIAELENGTKRPSQSALTAIAAALELRPSELLERAEALLDGEDAKRSEARDDVSWFHSAPSADVVDDAVPAALRGPLHFRRPDDDLRSLIESIVRRVVRDELEQAGITGDPGKQRRRSR